MHRYVVEYTVGVAGKIVRGTPMGRTAAQQYMKKVKGWPDVYSARLVKDGKESAVAKWKVEYKVVGHGPQVFTQGPYSDSDVDSHVADISGFEGVYGVVKVPARGGSASKEKTNG